MERNIKSAYIAAPFFTDAQVSIVEDIKSLLSEKEIDFTSPKDDFMFNPKADDPQSVIDWNCDKIRDSDIVVVVTDGKDVGTMWEAGFAYSSSKSIIYVWVEHVGPEAKFNIMLAQTGHTCLGMDSLSSCIDWLEEQIQSGQAFKLWQEIEKERME